MANAGTLSKEELQNVLKQLMEFSEVKPEGFKVPTGLLANLGLTPVNKEGGMKATNAQEVEVRQDLDVGQDFADGSPITLQTKRVSFLKEKARALASNEEFYEACKLLEDITDRDDSTDLGTKLLMTECYLQLGRENKANKCLERLERALNSNPLLPAGDMVNLADDLLDDSAYVRAIVIVNIAADLFLKNSAKPDESLSGVFRCCSKLDDIIKAMCSKGGRNTTIAADMGMENLVEMLEKLDGIKNCNRDQQAVKAAMCYRFLDHNYSLIDDHKKCLKYANLGIKKMENHFGAHGAQRYYIYGGQLHNLAITLGNMQRFEEAVAVYEKAVEAKENAIDYANDVDRQKDIDKAKRDLKQLRTVMG